MVHMGTIVIGIGGNALMRPSGGQAMAEEIRNINMVADSIALMCKNGNDKVIITHGNGTQVGDELERNEHARKYVPELPVHLLTAETQATIGSVIATALRNRMRVRRIDRDIEVVLAHVLVDGNDNAFKRPTKQIGRLYSAAELRKERGIDRFDYVKLGGMYRKVIASPKPKAVLEANAIAEAAKHSLVITCGGGGIPMAMRNGRINGISAVIDKDRTTGLLASSLNAERMVILTNAEYVYDGYPSKEKPVKNIKASALRKMLGKFEEGTMRPKLESCVDFIEKGGKEAYIGDILMLERILSGRSGTRVY